jgi:hypothetical protein
VPDSLDVIVLDNDAPGVLVLQSGGSTDVIEPTDIVRLGSGYGSQIVSTRFRIGLGLQTDSLGNTTSIQATNSQVWTVYLVSAATSGTVAPKSASITTAASGAVSFATIAAALSAKLGETTGEVFQAGYRASVSGEYLTITQSSGATFSVYVKVAFGRRHAGRAVHRRLRHRDDARHRRA